MVVWIWDPIRRNGASGLRGSEYSRLLPNVRCSRRAPAGLTDERLASGIAVAVIASVDGDALAAELGR